MNINKELLRQQFIDKVLKINDINEQQLFILDASRREDLECNENQCDSCKIKEPCLRAFNIEY